MKNIVVFGFGDMGKKLADECLRYGIGIRIKAIADNNPAESIYKGIPVIKPGLIYKYNYDEIWICTVYFAEIMEQLSDVYGIEKDRMHYVEPVVPILEYRLRKKYGFQMGCLSAVSAELKAVLGYLKDNPLRMYCYPFYDEYLNRIPLIRYDDSKGMYYGIYEGKRMYLSRKLDTPQKASAYFNAVTMEQDVRSPHCYWNNKKLCHVSGTGIDIGAAEGIFALKIIDHINYIYLIEADEGWTEALHYTFESYKDKVGIITKYAGNEDTENCIKLDTILGTEKVDFLKMDVEGMELEVLMGAEGIVVNNKMEMAVCVYHHEMDHARVSKWLDERGYWTCSSPGLVVCQGDWELDRDETDFRKALVFANNDERRF